MSYIKHKKRVLDRNRPDASEFGVSRYMHRGEEIYMLDTDGKVYRLEKVQWGDAERELHSLRTKEFLQRRTKNPQ